MKKIELILCVFFCITLCACCKVNSNTDDNGTETVEVDKEDSFDEVKVLAEKEERDNSVEDYTGIIEKYDELIQKIDAKRMSFIYLDNDNIPELLVLKNGQYRLYTLDGGNVREIVVSRADITMDAYGPRHEMEDFEKSVPYWFEYVPYQGLLRVHMENEGKRNDYYLRYENKVLEPEFKVESRDYSWQIYNGDMKISTEEFEERLEELGYNKLISCGYMYENTKDAIINIEKTLDTRAVLAKFVSGEKDAVEYVEEINDIPEEGYVTRNYEEIYKDITCDEEWWGKNEYIDIDNDGQEELIVHGYAGAKLFIDVIGETVYVLLRTDSTTDNAVVSELSGKQVIQRTDLLHAGREMYRVMEYDACGCLVKYFTLSVSYEGDAYMENDLFMYNDRIISMDEYETLVNSMKAIH